MIKKTIFVISFVLLTLGGKSQNEEVTESDNLDMEPFYELAQGLREEYINIDSDVFNLISKRDYVGENMILCDKGELQKIIDKISFELFGAKEKYASIADWKTMNILFGKGIYEEQALMNYLQESSFHLLCHGFLDNKQNYDNKIILDDKEFGAKGVAQLLLHELKGCDIVTKFTKRPFVVVVHSSGIGGKSKRSFASKLSKYLSKEFPNIYVVAASGAITLSISSGASCTETVIDSKGEIVNWNCFHAGKFIEEGEKDFAATVIKIQKEYLK